MGAGNAEEQQVTAAGLILGEAVVDDLLQDSFLRRLCVGWFQALDEEGRLVSLELAQQAQRVRELMARSLGWGFKCEWASVCSWCGVVCMCVCVCVLGGHMVKLFARVCGSFVHEEHTQSWGPTPSW